MAFAAPFVIPWTNPPATGGDAPLTWAEGVRLYWKLEYIRFDFQVTMTTAGTVNQFLSFGDGAGTLGLVLKTGPWAVALDFSSSDARSLAPASPLMSANYEFETDDVSFYGQAFAQGTIFENAGAPSFEFGADYIWQDKASGDAFNISISTQAIYPDSLLIDSIRYYYRFSPSDPSFTLDSFTGSSAFLP